MCCRCGCGSHYHEEGKEEKYELNQARRFLTREERVEKLKNYAEELGNELAGVEEHIKELESQAKLSGRMANGNTS
jgi:hypothetical protein